MLVCKLDTQDKVHCAVSFIQIFYLKYAKHFLFLRQWKSVLPAVNAKMMEKVPLAPVNH